MLVGASPSLAKRVPATLGALAIAAALGAALVPKFTAGVPQRANVVFRQDDQAARVFVDTTWGPATWGAPPVSMLDALGGPLRTASALPWMLPSQFAGVPRIDLEPPAADVLSVDDDGTRRHVRVRLRSRRGAPTVALIFPQGRHVEVKVEGRWASPRAVANGSMVGIFAVPPAGVTVELDSPVAGPIAVTLLDRSSGVPPNTKADAVVRARPADATPFQDGDVAVVTTGLSL